MSLKAFFLGYQCLTCRLFFAYLNDGEAKCERVIFRVNGNRILPEYPGPAFYTRYNGRIFSHLRRTFNGSCKSGAYDAFMDKSFPRFKFASGI